MSAIDPIPDRNLPLVLLHGWGMSRAVWEGGPGLLPPGSTGIPLDLPGHGDRAFTTSDRDLPAWVETCLRAAPPCAIWLGWSLGGLVALAAALRAPERIAGLILLTATPRFVRAADWTPALQPAILDQFQADLRADPSETLTRFLSLQVRGSPVARATLRSLRRRIAERPPPDPAALSVGLEILRDEDLRGRLPDIRCPSLWIFGSRDTLVPPQVAERVAILMPGARTAIIEGAAHAPQLSHPMRTLETIASFADPPDATPGHR